jgi:hypothetical protein
VKSAPIGASPGRALLQSMPIVNLAEEILKHMPGGESRGSGSVVGDVIGGLLRG